MNWYKKWLDDAIHLINVALEQLHVSDFIGIDSDYSDYNDNLGFMPLYFRNNDINGHTCERLNLDEHTLRSHFCFIIRKITRSTSTDELPSMIIEEIASGRQYEAVQLIEQKIGLIGSFFDREKIVPIFPLFTSYTTSNAITTSSVKNFKELSIVPNKEYCVLNNEQKVHVLKEILLSQEIRRKEQEQMRHNKANNIPESFIDDLLHKIRTNQ